MVGQGTQMFLSGGSQTAAATPSHCCGVTAKKLPGALVHMELAAVCESYGMFPRISHRRRAENTWADDLSEEKFAGWTPELRWLPGGGPCQYLALDALAAAARDSTC